MPKLENILYQTNHPNKYKLLDNVDYELDKIFNIH